MQFTYRGMVNYDHAFSLWKGDEQEQISGIIHPKVIPPPVNPHQEVISSTV